nr:MAG TPA: hypothetical protein [Caudoviricetes sp.]
MISLLYQKILKEQELLAGTESIPACFPHKKA